MLCYFTTDTSVITLVKSKYKKCHLLLLKMQPSFDISGAWVSMFEGTIKTASEQTLIHSKCELAPYHIKLI